MLFFLLKRIDICMRKSFDAVVARYELTDIQGHVLMFILNHENGLVHQNDLEKKFGVKKSTISGILSRLEKNGYIIRKTDNADSRFNNLVLTEKAHSVEKALEDNKKIVTKKLLSGFSEEEFNRLVNSLNKIYENVKEIGGIHDENTKNIIEKR